MLNLVVLAGVVTDAGVKLSYLPSGQPEARWTLLQAAPGKDGQTFRLFIPMVAYGARGETFAASLEAGDLVMVTGKLCWRTPAATPREPKPQGKLTVMAWTAEKVSASTAMAGSAN